MNDQQPVTKAELLEALRGLEERISQRMHDTETRLLTAIHGYAERGDLRLRRLEAAESSSAERIAHLEAGGLWAQLELRIVELERRVLGKQS
jgi:hypothetical protein